MHLPSRRDFLYCTLAASTGLAAESRPRAAGVNVHQQLLDVAAKQQEQRRARFAAVRSQADLEALQKDLRQKFLELLDGLPKAAGKPAARKTGQIGGESYLVEKHIYESLAGFLIPALL